MERLIDLIAGARPNFVKIAAVVDALVIARERGSRLRFRLVHTGQHFDPNMSGQFFEQLGIPPPDINLNVGPGTTAEQTGGIMVGYEKLLHHRKSDLCLVFGDVTSTMACAVTARKLGVPVGHVEAGLRSGDLTMPEEINRLVTDSISTYFFTTSEGANENLRRSGVPEKQIMFVGNTMIDTLLKHQPRFRAPAVWTTASLAEKKFFVLTLHRPSNVDDPVRLRALVDEIVRCSRGFPIVFPVHPRTAKNARPVALATLGLFPTEPLGYLEFNHLVAHAFAVVTDSGGVTEETTVLNVPCLTLRDSTERPETTTLGTNVLVGTNPAALAPHFQRLFDGGWKRGTVPPLWDGKSSERIVAHLERLLATA